MRQATDVREQATGHSVKKAPPRLTLSCSGHHCTKDIVNACRIALSVPLEPFIDVAMSAIIGKRCFLNIQPRATSSAPQAQSSVRLSVRVVAAHNFT
jgi:hypothetical protein